MSSAHVKKLSLLLYKIQTVSTLDDLRAASEVVNLLLRMPSFLLSHHCTLLIGNLPCLCLLLSSPLWHMHIIIDQNYWLFPEFRTWEENDVFMSEVITDSADQCVCDQGSSCFCLEATANLKSRQKSSTPVATALIAMFDSLATNRRTLGCIAQYKLCRKSAPKCASFSLSLARTIAIFFPVATLMVPNLCPGWFAPTTLLCKPTPYDLLLLYLLPCELLPGISTLLFSPAP